MHSRIYEFSLKPIPDTDIAGDFDVPDWWVGQYCDYCDVSNDTEDDLKWLNDYLKGSYDVEAKTITIPVDSIETILTKYYADFMTKLSELLKVTEEEWKTKRNDVSYTLYQLDNAFNERFGFWFYDSSNFGEMLTEQDILYKLRTMKEDYLKGGVNNKDNPIEHFTLYIGKIWDYHF